MTYCLTVCIDLRWGRDGEAVQPEKCLGAENCLGCAREMPQRPGRFVGLRPFTLEQLLFL